MLLVLLCLESSKVTNTVGFAYILISLSSEKSPYSLLTPAVLTFHLILQPSGNAEVLPLAYLAVSFFSNLRTCT